MKRITLIVAAALLIFTLLAVPVIAQQMNKTFTITCNVTGNVFIGNILKGQTPLTVKLDFGSYPFRVEAAGYQTYTSTLVVNASTPATMYISLVPVQGTTTTTTTTQSGGTGHLTVTSDVPALVYLSGTLVGPTPFSKDIKSGTWTLRVTPNDKQYAPKEESITIVNGQTLTKNYTFIQVVSQISINANVQSQVYINNQLMGTTPVTIPLAPGNYSLKLVPTVAGYQQLVQTITVSGNQAFNFTLTQMNFQVSFNANIPSQVYVNDQQLGTTPVTLSLAAGTYTVKLVPTVSGYQQLIQTITVNGNQVFNFTLTQMNYQVAFKTNIQAQVYINDQLKGTTPLTLNLAAGTYSIKLVPSVAGYQELVQTITVSGNQTFNFTLQTLPQGYIKINLPPNAKLYINGQRYNFNSNQLIQLPPGTYEIRVEYGDFIITKNVTVQNGQTIVISIVFDLAVTFS